MAIMNVPITKGKGTVQIDTDAIPEAVFAEALLQGLKVLANRGASKITKETYPEATEMQAAALAKANEQVEAIMSGNIKFTGGKASTKVSGAVKTEARRLAKAAVKDAIKASGGKVSHVEASEITKAAKAYLEADPAILALAEKNLAERESVPKPTSINLAELIKASPKLVAAAEAKKAEKKPLSAKQAGMTAKRKKGEQPSATAH